MAGPRSGFERVAKSHFLRRALAIAACIFVVAALSACSERVNLQTSLKDGDANEILSTLSRNGIDAKKTATKEGVTLTVKEADIARATDVMQAAGLPRRSLSSLGQIFKKEGMISTPLEERARYIYGLSQELEHTLQEFDRVVAARVHVVLPERVAPGEAIQPSSAAVFIKYRPPFDEDSNLPRIRQLVASSIPGLTGEEGLAKVSIVMSATENTEPNIEWTKVGPFSIQAGSASSLTYTLLGLILLCVVALVWALGMTAARDSRVMEWCRNAMKRFPLLNAAGIGKKPVPKAATNESS